MVRGHAKAVSQERKAAKDAEKAKSVKRDSSEVIFDSAFYIILFLEGYFRANK